MVTRIVPWPLPTIPGQATNENPGGGEDVGTITYIELDGLQFQASIKGGANGSYPQWPTYNKANGDGLQFTISGVEVIDITGVSVIETVTWTALVDDAPVDYAGGSYTMAGDPGEASYSVGANVNRSFSKINAIQMYNRGNPVDNGWMNNDKTVGSATLTVKVVNSVGAVLQSKTMTADVVVRAE